MGEYKSVFKWKLGSIKGPVSPTFFCSPARVFIQSINRRNEGGREQYSKRRPIIIDKPVCLIFFLFPSCFPFCSQRNFEEVFNTYKSSQPETTHSRWRPSDHMVEKLIPECNVRKPDFNPACKGTCGEENFRKTFYRL